MQTWWFLSVLIFSIIGFKQVLSQQAFISQPSDVTVIVGNGVTLQCSVSDKQGVVIWSKDGESLSSDYALNSGVSADKFNVADAGGGEYNLVITGATISDSGDYICEVTGDSINPSLTSNTATVTVEPEQGFVSIPPLRSERQTDDISLECVTRDKSGQLEWYKESGGDLLKLSSDTDVIESFDGRFSITGDQLQGQYILSISNLQYSDAGDYLCHLTTQGVQPSVWSQRCELSVEDPIPPGESYPVCEIPPPPYEEGDNITIICRSQGGYPSAQLAWSSNGVELPSEILETGSGSTRVALNLMLDHSHSVSALVCTSSYGSKSCQVGPLDINLLTRIRVDLTPEILEMEEDDSASLVCNASVTEGAPPITSYEWSYENQNINISDKRFSRETLSVTSSTLFILSAEKNMDDAKVVCVAKSDVDAQMATASIRIVESTLFGLSYQLLAAVVALVIGIVVALIVVGIIIYCVWKKRQQKEEEEERKITRTIEESTVSANVGSGNRNGVQPYGKDDKYDYYIVYNGGKHNRSGKPGKHRHSSKGKQNIIVPYNGNTQLLDRSLPPIPLGVPPPYYQDDEHDRHKRRKRRRRHRRHSDDEYDDDYDKHRHSRRSRSESRDKDDRGRNDDYAVPKKRRSRRRDRDSDNKRSRSEPPRSSTRKQRDDDNRRR